jgi:hypothetical protein
MGVPTSAVGYTPTMPRREDHEVHKAMWWHWTKKKIFSKRRNDSSCSLFKSHIVKSCCTRNITSFGKINGYMNSKHVHPIFKRLVCNFIYLIVPDVQLNLDKNLLVLKLITLSTDLNYVVLCSVKHFVHRKMLQTKPLYEYTTVQVVKLNKCGEPVVGRHPR